MMKHYDNTVVYPVIEPPKELQNQGFLSGPVSKSDCYVEDKKSQEAPRDKIDHDHQNLRTLSQGVPVIETSSDNFSLGVVSHLQSNLTESKGIPIPSKK